VRIGTRRRIGGEAFSIEDGAHRSLAALFSKGRENPLVEHDIKDNDFALT
jgi:hypothetical protein